MSIAAELHGKTPFVYSEDILTSDVFTTFRYLPAQEGIIGFLIDGLVDFIPPPEATSTCKLYFWPRGDLREPDVLLELQIRGQLYHVIVEAKYLSGPSDGEAEATGETVQDSEAIRRTGNQLADQFLDLRHGHYRINRTRWTSSVLQLGSTSNDRFLLYLTAHHLRPDEELTRCHERCPASDGRLFWTSWYQVHDYIAEKSSELTEPYGLITADLIALLRQKGFCPFHGLPLLPVLRPGGLPKFMWQVVPPMPVLTAAVLPDFHWKR